MIDRVASALAPIVDSIVIVANSPGAASWLPGARVVPDVLEGGGSAAGLHAALRATERPTIVVAWDLPFVTTALLRLVASAAGPASDAAVPAGRVSGEFEPLCAWYAPRCADEIEAEWASGDRSLHGLLRRVSTVVVPVEAIAPLGSAERFFFNVNSEADLSHARRMAADDSAPPSA
jgi:molybdopterin-guanine dinucleotide biosynthesis protein A